MPRIRVYIATSLDGCIAGEGDDLSWLPTPDPEAPLHPDALDYESFMRGIGALLMGRRTFDVVRGFDMAWPYGDRPVLVASHRALGGDLPPTVRRVSGTIDEVVAEARRAAGGQDVYLDGGAMIRQACAAGLVDDLVVTVFPVALGSGHALFAGMTERYPMRLVKTAPFPGGGVQLHLVPGPTPPSTTRRDGGGRRPGEDPARSP